jgi:hypothetical protein
MNIQWTYNDLRTKGPIIRNVQSWKIDDPVDVNRGTYRDTWPLALPYAFPKVVGGNGVIIPDDGSPVPNSATASDVNWVESLWTGTSIGKVRVPDEMMHAPPRTRYEGVIYLKFYDDVFVTSSTPTVVITGVTSNNTTNVVTKTAHGFVTGDIVKFIGGTNWATLVAETLYYVVKIDADTFYLATSLANAYAATVIDLTGTNGTVGVFLGMASVSEPSGDVVGSVQQSEIVCWNVV